MFDLSSEEETRALKVHSKSLVVDTHCDRIMTLMPPPPSVLPDSSGEVEMDLSVHLDKLGDGGVDCQVFAVYVSPAYHPIALRRALQMIDVFNTEVERNRNRVALCTDYSEIVKCADDGTISAVLSIEGGEPLMGDLRMLRIFHTLGVRALGLTHFPRNRLADGSAEMRSNSGLSSFGVLVVEEMNRLGMIIDVSHINEKGFWDVIEVSKDPVLASHSNCKSLCDHHRNLSDEQVKALSEKGGVMGITYVAPFLEKAPGGADDFRSPSSVSRILDHIDYAVKLVGSDHVGLGSDYMGRNQTRIKGLEDISKLPNVTRGLVSRGYSDSEIRKILGGNFLRVFERVLH